MTRRIYGNDRRTEVNDVRPPVTSNTAAAMFSSLAPELPKFIPPRPSLASQQSSSLPSTPYQHPRDRSFRSRTPSPAHGALNASPRSSHSESNQSLPALRRLPGGCKYESGMAQARRRVPYSLGPDKLGPEGIELKAHLSAIEDVRLSGDMENLFNQLTPSPRSEERRRKLVQKLEDLFNATWPGHSIKVNVFGSTGNKLGTNESDVDICIMTDFEDLEQVCCLAELLANNGMERVVCVSGAKVPIVKIWDPELELACDMNVNNPVALENTEMIRTYVDIDDRVRPLAMIIKYWARRRVLNDPALGSTLSSYTWICMIINFLQARSPPILPSLQQSPYLKKKVMNGVNVAFDKDVTLYRGFGKKNKESLGELLLQFFRYYGHEVDFEQSVMSVRLGKVISKKEKGWDRLLDNRICVEEPFNIRRNLANTADDTSVRGIHLELRRAFKMLSEDVDLEKCCEQYEHPLDEAKTTSDRFVAPPSRPVIPQAPPRPSREARGGGRGGRNASHFNRSAHNYFVRRASNPANRGPAFTRTAPFQMTAEELQFHAQHQQYVLHDQLFQQYQLLQAQEQELRIQLHQQGIMQGRVPPAVAYPNISFPSYSAQEGSRDKSTRTRVGTVNHPPLSAPLRQQDFPNAIPYAYAGTPSGSESATNPPSPSLHSVGPERRRNTRRSTLASGSSGGSLRAQSQPARPVPSPLSFFVPQDMPDDQDTVRSGSTHYRRLGASPKVGYGCLTPSYLADGRFAYPISAYNAERRQTEYVGYYVGHSPPAQAYPRSGFPSPVAGNVGLAIHDGGGSPGLFTRTPTYQLSTVSPPCEPLQTQLPDPTSEVVGSMGSPVLATQRPFSCSPSKKADGPLIVDGSTPVFERQLDNNLEARGHSHGTTFSGSTSDDMAFDTPTSSDGASQGLPESVIADNEAATGVVNESGTKTPNLAQRPDAFGIPKFNEEAHSLDTLWPSKHDEDAIIDKSTHPMKLELSASNGLGSKNAGFIKEVGQSPALPERKKGLIKGESQLSPVKEIPNTPLTESTEVFTMCKNIPDGADSRRKERAEQEKSVFSDLDVEAKNSEPLVVKPNGMNAKTLANRGPTTGPTIGWQTQKKKKQHKKASKSENDIRTNAVGGDFLPAEISLRKGG